MTVKELNTPIEKRLVRMSDSNNGVHLVDDNWGTYRPRRNSVRHKRSGSMPPHHTTLPLQFIQSPQNGSLRSIHLPHQLGMRRNLCPWFLIVTQLLQRPDHTVRLGPPLDANIRRT